MDPDQALIDIKSFLDTKYPSEDETITFIVRVQGLVEHLDSGGFPPQAWIAAYQAQERKDTKVLDPWNNP